MKNVTSAFACALILCAVPVHANIEVKFVESASKDRFIVSNTGECELTDLIVKLDLSDSTGKLIFDTTAKGAGVEVFQPFEIREGDIELISSSAVLDGDKTLSIKINSLPSNQQVSFTIDVDDTLVDSALGQIRVTGAEIENSTVELQSSKLSLVSTKFDKNSVAIVSNELCL